MDIIHKTCAKGNTTLGYRVRSRNRHHFVLTMIHGLASNQTRWTEFMQNSQLLNYCDLMSVDLRGRGLSPYRGQYSRSIWVEDVKAILEKEHYEKTVLIGHSMGAQIALEYAFKHPNRTAGLILIDPVFPTALSGNLNLAQRFRTIIWLLIRATWFFNKIGFQRRLIPTRDLYDLDISTRERLNANKALSISDLYANPFDDAKYLPLANYLQDLYEVTRPLPDLRSINTPSLVLLSKGATLINKKENEKAILSLPNEVTTVIDADHWLLTEKPEESRLAIEQWFIKHYTRK